MMQDVYIIDGARTPVGLLQGSLSNVSAIELGIIASKGAIERSRVDPNLIDQIVMGNVIQSSKDAVYLPRHIGLKVGIPIETPAFRLPGDCDGRRDAPAGRWPDCTGWRSREHDAGSPCAAWRTLRL